MYLFWYIPLLGILSYRYSVHQSLVLIGTKDVFDMSPKKDTLKEAEEIAEGLGKKAKKEAPKIEKGAAKAGKALGTEMKKEAPKIEKGAAKAGKTLGTEMKKEAPKIEKEASKAGKELDSLVKGFEKKKK